MLELVGSCFMQKLVKRKAPIYRSIRSGTPTFIHFTNESQKTVAIFWVDYNGKRRCYSILYPGKSTVQGTHLTHPWVAFFVERNQGKLRVDDSVDAPVAVFKVYESKCSAYQKIFYPVPMEIAAYSEHKSSISIVELPKVRWNPQIHSRTFTREFKRQAQAVLLCQHRLHRQLGKNSGAHFGELPQDIVLDILASMAPCIMDPITKPSLPYGAIVDDFTARELVELFRV